MPTVRRAELESDDIVAAFGLVKMRCVSTATTESHGSRASQCSGKKSFSSKKKADFAARRLSGCVSYRCRYCHDWHVGGKLDR